jgi:probable rRNA maturation factor
MARGFQGSRRQHQRSAAVPSRSSSATAKHSLQSSDAPSQAVALRLGTAALRRGGSNRRHSAIQDHPMPERQRTLTLHNRQTTRRLDLRLLRRITRALLQETRPQGACELAIYFVAEPEMTHLNETFLRHKGSTDVISFDYSPCSPLLHGEIFVCLDEAVSQARRFHTTWQSELVRYVVHGVLHLLGFDDTDSRTRRSMKTREDALVRQLARRFDFQAASPRPRPPPPKAAKSGTRKTRV